MTIREKKARVLARQLLALSFADGTLSGERVGAVLAWFSRTPPPHPLVVLKAYRGLVAHEIARSQAVISHAGPVPEAAVAAIAAALSSRYRRPIGPVCRPNPALLAGITVRVGDDLFESSVSGQLAALSAAR